MNALYDIVIKPMESKLTDEENQVIALIGMTLQIVAKKARAYEQTFEKGEVGLPENFQN